MSALDRRAGWVFANDTDIAPVQFTQAPYTPWSDNHTWAAYGVPSPLIMSWPDLHFHTQFLTADNTDPRVFRRAGVTTALAAYEIADAGAAEAWTIAADVASRSAHRLDEIANRASHRIVSGDRVRPDAADTERVAARAHQELRYAAMRDQHAVASVRSLIAAGDRPALDGEITALGNHLQTRAEQAAARLDLALRMTRQGDEQS